jgi:hypothetical protein
MQRFQARLAKAGINPSKRKEEHKVGQCGVGVRRARLYLMPCPWSGGWDMGAGRTALGSKKMRLRLKVKLTWGTWRGIDVQGGIVGLKRRRRMGCLELNTW